jgi:hypothetical protein
MPIRCEGEQVAECWGKEGGELGFREEFCGLVSGVGGGVREDDEDRIERA